MSVRVLPLSVFSVSVKREYSREYPFLSDVCRQSYFIAYSSAMIIPGHLLSLLLLLFLLLIFVVVGGGRGGGDGVPLHGTTASHGTMM